MVERALERAKTECQKFLDSSFPGPHERMNAFMAVLKEANSAIVATSLQASLDKRGLALEIYNGHMNHGVARQVVKVSLGQNGQLIREDLITCQDGCHTFAAKTSRTTLDSVVKDGISLKTMAENIMRFLSDPSLSMSVVSKGLKN